jgi:hypothetical protein
MYIRTHSHLFYVQSQGLESAAMKKDTEQNDPIFKAIEFAPTLTEGE